MADLCLTCRFWVATAWEPDGRHAGGRVATYGDCRRGPPKAGFHPSLHGGSSVFPITAADCGCGEHRLFDREEAVLRGAGGVFDEMEAS